MNVKYKKGVIILKIYKKNEHIKNSFMSAVQKCIKGDYAEHGHDFFEIEFIIDGTGTYIVDGNSYPIDKNMLFLMSPIDIHAIKNCDVEIINVMFPCHLFSAPSLFPLFAPNAVRVFKFSDHDATFIHRLLCEVVSAQTIDYAEQFLRCLLYKIASNNDVQKTQDNTHIQAAIIYILENFYLSLTLEKTAEYLRLAPAYFSSLFQKEMGIGFKEYLDNIRFDHALKLLTFTNMPVCEICSASGFADYTNFARRFKSKYHCAPTGYRKMNREHIK